MHPAIKSLIPTAEAIVKLLHPHAEVVIHDIDANRIAAIFNAFSKRKTGDDALLSQKDIPRMQESTECYMKTNWDGRQLKSISSLIRDAHNKPVGLLCINLDVSELQACQQLIQQFLQTETIADQPAALFADDWHQRINQYVSQYLHEQKISIKSATRHDKQKLITHLYDIGAFSAKNAANYIASILNISRATVYKYLNQEDKQ